MALRTTPSPKPLPAPSPPHPVVGPIHAQSRVQPPARLVASTPPGHSGAALRPQNAHPIWDIPGAHAISASLGEGGGAGATGHGLGALGNGNSAASGDEPCGFVTFSDPHGSHFDPRTRGFYVDIRMSVHFADGTSQSMILDYPWYYATEAANPWSDQNLRDPDFPMRFQGPPVGRADGEPPLVQYVAGHSTADGMTLLKECPSPMAPAGEAPHVRQHHR